MPFDLQELPQALQVITALSLSFFLSLLIYLSILYSLFLSLSLLVRIKYYNGCLFHTVQKDFTAQTGDPTGTGLGGDSIYK